MTEDRVVTLPAHTVSDERRGAGEPGTGSDSEFGRVTMGVQVPADRRLVLTVQTLAQLATIAQDEGVPLDDGLVQGVETLAHRLRGAGLDLPAHLEAALAEIGRSLKPASSDPEVSGGSVLLFPGPVTKS